MAVLAVVVVGVLVIASVLVVAAFFVEVTDWVLGAVDAVVTHAPHKTGQSVLAVLRTAVLLLVQW